MNFNSTSSVKMEIDQSASTNLDQQASNSTSVQSVYIGREMTSLPPHLHIKLPKDLSFPTVETYSSSPSLKAGQITSLSPTSHDSSTESTSDEDMDTSSNPTKKRKRDETDLSDDPEKLTAIAEIFDRLKADLAQKENASVTAKTLDQLETELTNKENEALTAQYQKNYYKEKLEASRAKCKKYKTANEALSTTNKALQAEADGFAKRNQQLYESLHHQRTINAELVRQLNIFKTNPFTLNHKEFNDTLFQ